MSFANISGEGHPALLHVYIRQTIAAARCKKKVSMAETFYLCLTGLGLLLSFITILSFMFSFVPASVSLLPVSQSDIDKSVCSD